MDRSNIFKLFALFVTSVLIFGCVGQPIDHSVSPDADPPRQQASNNNTPSKVDSGNDTNLPSSENNTIFNKTIDEVVAGENDTLDDTEYGGFNFSDEDEEDEDIWEDEEFGLDPLFINGTLIPDPDRGSFKTRYCTVRTSDFDIFQNKELKVSITVHAQNNERITLYCNDEEAYIAKGGLIYDYKICKYSQTGLNNVWVALDGQICASTPIFVFNDATKDFKACQVISTTREEVKKQEYSKEYSASIFLDNIPRDTEITYNCNEKKFTKKLSDLTASALVSGTYKITCDFSQDPGYISDTSVYAGDIYCGDIVQ